MFHYMKKRRTNCILNVYPHKKKLVLNKMTSERLWQKWLVKVDLVSLMGEWKKFSHKKWFKLRLNMEYYLVKAIKYHQQSKPSTQSNVRYIMMDAVTPWFIFFENLHFNIQYARIIEFNQLYVFIWAIGADTASSSGKNKTIGIAFI